MRGKPKARTISVVMTTAAVIINAKTTDWFLHGDRDASWPTSLETDGLCPARSSADEEAENPGVPCLPAVAFALGVCTVERGSFRPGNRGGRNSKIMIKAAKSTPRATSVP